jgi:phosphoglycolate phosphatase
MPHDVVFVGDHVRDVQAGKAAGMHTIAAAWGYINTPSEAESWHADAVCYRSQDLHQVIKDWQ